MFDPFGSIVSLYPFDLKWTCFDQLMEKLDGTVGTVLIIHVTVCPSGAFIYRRVSIILVSIWYTFVENILFIHLNLLNY